MAVLNEGMRRVGILRTVGNGPLERLELGQAPPVLGTDDVDRVLGAGADAQDLDGNVEAVAIEDVPKDPGAVENGDRHAVRLFQRVLRGEPFLRGKSLISNEEDLGVAAPGGDDLGDVGAYLIAPFFLGAECEGPALVRGSSIRNVPAQRNCGCDRIGLGVGLTVAAARWPGLRDQVRRNEPLG